MKTVFVGLSGGVDSSVVALRLKQQGFNVVGVYMKNWSKDLPGFSCPWKQDYMDAKRISVQLGIDFVLFDFEKQYFDKVVKYMIEEYKIGRTPNPDIMCNQEIKFKLFFETALKNGADLIATGHYARAIKGELYAGVDSSKDQSYFLYRIPSSSLLKTYFPLGESNKKQVKLEAKKYGLITANKKESMGICFVGKVGIKEFLKQYVNTEPGPIVDQFGVTIGEHEGAIFYTIGQRHGLRVGGGLPMYVVSKDMKKNIVYVTSQIDDSRLWQSSVKLTSPYWINEPPIAKKIYKVRSRYRAPLVSANFNESLKSINFIDPIRAVTPGQSIVVYDDEKVLGGAIVS